MEEPYRIPEREAAHVLCHAWTSMGAPATPDMFQKLIRALSCNLSGQQRAGNAQMLREAAEGLALHKEAVTLDGTQAVLFSGFADEPEKSDDTIAVSLAPTIANGLFDVHVMVEWDDKSDMTMLVQFLAVMEKHHAERQGLLVLARAAIAAFCLRSAALR